MENFNYDDHDDFFRDDLDELRGREVEYDDYDNLPAEVQAELNAYYDWLEIIAGPQEMPEDFDLRPV